MNLTPEDGLALLAIARAAIAAGFDAHVEAPAHTTSALDASCGVFVTLRRGGRLRGCIGRVESHTPLNETTAAVARASAFEDPRFPPLSKAEFAGVSIEVSVLSPLSRVGGPDEVVVGQHGVLIGSGGRRGLLLPQVPVENDWDRATYLSHACVKAGLATDAWQEPDTVIQVFSAQIFSE